MATKEITSVSDLKKKKAGWSAFYLQSYVSSFASRELENPCLLLWVKFLFKGKSVSLVQSKPNSQRGMDLHSSGSTVHIRSKTWNADLWVQKSEPYGFHPALIDIWALQNREEHTWQNTFQIFLKPQNFKNILTCLMNPKCILAHPNSSHTLWGKHLYLLCASHINTHTHTHTHHKCWMEDVNASQRIMWCNAWILLVWNSREPKGKLLGAQHRGWAQSC